MKWVPLPKSVVRRVKGGYHDPEDDPSHVLGDLVLEVDPAGETVRTWKSWQHFDPATEIIFEVTRDKKVVWEYINPFFIQNRRLGDRINMVFRAHRYGVDHPALADRDLDPARYANLNRLYAEG